MQVEKTITAIIVDDSMQARNLLNMMLQTFAPHFQICGQAKNGNEGLQLIQDHQPDVVFLDIEMPGKTGLQLAEEVVKLNLNCTLVFTTAYNQYAIQAFELSALDYLLKPIQEENLIKTIARIENYQNAKNALLKLQVFLQNTEKNELQKITIPTLNGVDIIDLDEISSVSADGAYTEVKLSNGQIKVFSKNLKYFENTLSGITNFMRIHRSFIINLKRVSSYLLPNGTGSVKMANGDCFDIARDRKSEFNKAIQIMNYSQH